MLILAAVLIAIAAYYPIKLIKFYSMESFEQGLKAKITQDLREGRVSNTLISLVLGNGGFRLMRNQLDVIFEWMVQNTNAWHVHAYADEKVVVVFARSPFHPEEWDNYEDYKHVMRQMFDEYGTDDFLTARTTTREMSLLKKELAAIGNPIKPYDYVRIMLGDEKVLAMVLDINDNNEKLLAILSGTGRGLEYWASCAKAMEVISNDVAIAELVRLKEEWKNKKREEAIAEQRETFREKYGNIVRGSYLKSGISLYIVESVDMDEEKATAIRLLYSFIKQPAGEKCILPLEKGFKLITAEEAAEIILKEYE